MAQALSTRDSLTLLAIAFGVIGLGVWYISRPSHAVDAQRTPAAVASQLVDALPKPDANAEARDTAAVIIDVYPKACRAAEADSKWVACHDDVKGYAASLKCIEAAVALAHNAAQSFKSPPSSSPCGKNVAAAATSMVTTMPLFLDDFIVWMKSNRKQLEPAMAGKTLSDVCSGGVDCSQQPTGGPGSDKYEKASWATISGVECTKDLFQCGRFKDNVCWINKVADRLDVACDPQSNKGTDPLFVRATGVRLNR